MQQSETVTFGGGGLDRRADLRGDPDGLDALARGDLGRHLLIWRGKVLATTDGEVISLARLGWNQVPQGYTAPARIYLGGNAGDHFFAHDISVWEPDAGPPATLGAFHDPSQQSFPGLEGMVFCELRSIMAGLTPLDAELAATAKAILGWHVSHRFCSACGQASVAAEGGWQRNCPHCMNSHFPRTDPVVIMLILHGNSVLLGRSPGWPDGMYSLLAGFVEPGETIEAAVRREVLEESSVVVGDVDYLASQPWPFPASLMIGCRGQALGTDITIDPQELEDARWATRAEMLAAMAGDHPVFSTPRQGSIARFLIEKWLADALD